MMIPEQIRAFLRFLNDANHQAYLVGGCVRDSLLGIAPHDWDVCTDALPEDLCRLFPNALTYGIRHGTVTVPWQDELIEVTTFRTESGYSDYRRPDAVRFVRDLKTDLSRRDFTINAIAADADGRLRDPFEGESDLHAGILRTVGAAEERFREDALRMLRAIRFSAQLGFSIEQDTQRAIRNCAYLAANLSAERVASEVEKTILTSRPEFAADMIGMGLLKHWGISEVCDDPMKMLHLPPDRVKRWSGFRLLTGQNLILKTLRLDNRSISISELCAEIRNETARDTLFWKRMIHHVGDEHAAAAAEILSAWDGTDDVHTIRAIIDSGDCCSMKDLAISGEDLIRLGYRGKEIGQALDRALQYVWTHPDRNNSAHLLPYLREED